MVLSSFGHRSGRLNVNDLNWEKRTYNPNKTFFDTKLPNLYFAYELAERLKKNTSQITVTAAHPGWTATVLQRYSGLLSFLNNFFAQGVEMGALPTLRAAFDTHANSGDYFGPSRFFEMRGYPVNVQSTKRSHDMNVARALWEASEKMTGVRY